MSDEVEQLRQQVRDLMPTSCYPCDRCGGIRSSSGCWGCDRIEASRYRAALVRLRDCDFVITPADRMDAVRAIARAALEGKDLTP